ncbi:MAG: hypothetical protein NMNS01_04020 [Nitrosomonas sp.]|nr:MAG: hypothetical protein NMNS01_04020 [Nitrosomonas sp.]
MRVIVLLISTLLALPASAHEWPDLLGVWKGTTRTVIAGVGGHFSDSVTSEAHFREVELTIEWIEEDDGRYIGTVTSANHTERKLGVMSSDGNSFYTVDNDGHSTGRLIDEDHFELCYLQSSFQDEQMVASCVTFERQA